MSERCVCVKETEIAEINSLSKRNASDIKALSKQSEVTNDLSRELAKLSNEIKHMNNSLNELKEDVKELKAEKGKWYDKVKWLVVSMLVGSVVTLYLTQIMGCN